MRRVSMPRKIVLASASPRRRDILRKAGLEFIIDAADYEEDLGIELPPRRLACLLSHEKAKVVASRHHDAIIIAADTFIAFRNRLLGKPHTKAMAKKMLLMLSGKAHSVITGYTIIDTASGERVSRSVETKVWFRRLSEHEIDAYIATGEPLDKAGAYAIQELGALLVRKIEGDYLNVVGLPLVSLAGSLRKFGVKLL